jgi:hypothetical protein
MIKEWDNMVTAPDFDMMMEIAQKVGDLTAETLKLDIQIKDAEAQIVKEVTTNVEYFKDGKCLAMNQIEPTYKYRGLNGELIPLRWDYADKKGQLEKYKLMFQALQDLVKIFQTESSNQRSSLL